MLPKILVFIFATTGLAYGDDQPTNQLTNRSTIVHLFEWKWQDIAEECERFLALKGYGGVQISPPSENVIIHIPDGSRRPWYERYQVMSYMLKTRSGDEKDFLDMTTRCNRVGVRIYADVVVNHMTADNKENIGTGGSTADFQNYNYPAVPYTREHFHKSCSIDNYNNAAEVRNCQLVSLKDLNQTEDYVREKIIDYFNHLIKLGVAGLRVDAAKHMWPNDLKEIYHKLNDLNTEFGFAVNSRPYIYQEVIYFGNEAIKPQEYTWLGSVVEFRVGAELKEVFRGRNALKWLVNWGEEWGLSPSKTALISIDNHDTQRDGNTLTYKESRAYKGATAFILAHTYGEPRVMSSFFFEDKNQGPPSDGNEEILSPTINEDDTCGNGWVCEHRWRQIYQMIAFKNAVKGTKVENWWDNNNNQIAFSRGNKGFIVFNLESYDLNQTLQTGLPAGIYCDVISGKIEGTHCTGKKVTVDTNGRVHIMLPVNAEDIHLALHVGPESRLSW